MRPSSETKSFWCAYCPASVGGATDWRNHYTVKPKNNWLPEIRKPQSAGRAGGSENRDVRLYLKHHLQGTRARRPSPGGPQRHRDQCYHVLHGQIAPPGEGGPRPVRRMWVCIMSRFHKERKTQRASSFHPLCL